MIYIECPEKVFKTSNQLGVFLAGGFEGCAFWQLELARLLEDVDCIVYNPRRKIFPVDDPGAVREQIEWEFKHLHEADVISFWFCKEGIQPIVMYELGFWSARDKPIAVGVEPGFWREQDVRIQTQLCRPGVDIVDSLQALSLQIKHLIGG